MPAEAQVARSQVEDTAEAYYDSPDADQFYATVWGGEDIHVGLYESETEPVRVASRRTVERMAGLLAEPAPGTKVLDLGAGYGGAARYLAATYGCRVTCLNLSDVQNERNRELTREQKLDHLVTVTHGSFEDIPEQDETFDVVWSQDAILHSGDRERVLRETKRVLVEGGQFIFTDPMQADDCPPGVLQPILDRIHLSSLGSVGFYKTNLEELQFEEIGTHVMTQHLGTHYARIKAELTERFDEITQTISPDYVNAMLKGLQHWVDGADKGYLAWGILHYRRF